MNYEKKYKDALDWMRDIYPALTGAVKEDAEHFFPELAENEDERTRKELINFVKQYAQREVKEKFVSWLEKLKEFQFGYPGIYFYDGEKLHFQGNPAMEEKQKEQKPNYYHHEVDETGWTEEYRKAYYDGWNNCNMQHSQLQAEQKPAEWSEEDKKIIFALNNCIDELVENHGWSYVYSETDDISISRIRDWLKSLRPQSKEERKPMEIKYGGKIYQVHGMRTLPGGAIGYIIEDEPGHYDCIMNPEEVLGGGYGVKQNGSPYPTKGATFDESHWKPSEEQMEVDLEKELRNYNVPFNDCGWERLTHNTLKEIARHFYELGLNARKEK